MSIYRQRLTRSLKIDFEIPPLRALRGKDSKSKQAEDTATDTKVFGEENASIPN